ncbi:MAG: outer membrane protein assembly factor BamA [Gammaproteobacteria bacterium]|nr:outer membrane protein assembly factor BamA [Gammaproteobacteria bacterium]
MVFISIKRFMLGVLFATISLPVMAESFRLQDIQVEGLERIEAGTVFTYLPIKVGDELDENQTSNIIRTLYKTGFFDDIQLRREGNVLVVVVKEKPAIASINFDGNKILDDEQLTEVLTSVGIAQGRVFNRSVLERLENELLQQYFAFGKYSVNINTQVRELARNRVDVAIQIVEGDVAKIKQVRIVGNTSFEEDELIEDFESGLKPWYKFWGGRDRYAKQKLQGDIEILRSHYLNQGYLKFDVTSAQVSISPDKKDIFVTININEGDQYTLEGFDLAGTFIFPKEELMSLVHLTPGETFSRGEVVKSTDAISRRLGDVGYAFPNINAIPEIDEEMKSVNVTFFIDPGKRVYVRRVNFRGHEATRDEVYRRELRQMEAGWYSQSKVEASRKRIQRLAYVESVEIETLRIPGIDDFVDLDIIITERLAGSFNIGAGFSGSHGAVITTSVQQENFLGTGKTVGFRINTSKANTVYDFNYTNPYHTIDGVSRGFGASYVSTEASEADISDFDSDQYAVRVSYGIPLTENDRIGATAQARHTEIDSNLNTPLEVREFLVENGDKYDNLTLTTYFTHDTRNRSLFPSKGNRQTLTFELSVPGSDLEFYKLDYENAFYFSLGKVFTLSLGGAIGYGDQYGDTSDLPFYEKFRAGGFSSVRGYENNSLGPRDSFGDSFGGNFLTTARAQVFFPPPFLDNKGRARLAVFVDMGNVFEEYDDFETSEVRGSVGLGVNWITGIGGISAAIASTFNDDSEDDIDAFQFELGTSF